MKVEVAVGYLTSEQESKVKKYQLSAQSFMKKNGVFGKYFYCNLMSVDNQDWYTRLFESLGASYYDGVMWASDHCGGEQWIYRHLGHDIACLRVPIVYFVNMVTPLKDDVVWWRMRQNASDIVVDLDGNIFSVGDIVGEAVIAL